MKPPNKEPINKDTNKNQAEPNAPEAAEDADEAVTPDAEPEADNAGESAAEPEGPEADTADTPEPSVEEQLAAERDRYLRLAAEFDNFRRRSQRERETLYADAKAAAAARFLTLYDNIVRARGQMENDEEKAEFYQVADMMKRQFDEAFHALGVELISGETETGKPFDPGRHDAIMNVPPGEGADENSVALVIQSGCAAGGRVVKHAAVAVVRQEQ